MKRNGRKDMHTRTGDWSLLIAAASVCKLPWQQHGTLHYLYNGVQLVRR